jgi:hypothetical protein
MKINGKLNFLQDEKYLKQNGSSKLGVYMRRREMN